MTPKEFEERIAGGEQLVLLDDLVLDISQYEINQPGGRFVIDHNIGRDISTFFYGGYDLELSSGYRPYLQSNVASNGLKSLEITQPEKQGETILYKQDTRTKIH